MSGAACMKRSMVVAAFVVLGGVVVAATSVAQTIRLYADEAGTSDVLLPPPIGQETSFYVGVDSNSLGLTAISFSLPIPDCIPYSVARVTPLDGFQVSGELETGIDIAPSGCRTGKIVMLKVDVVRTDESTPGCCAIEVAPSAWSPIPGELVGVDCADNLRPLDECNLVMEGETACVQLLPPSDPSPANGAVDVPTDANLDFVLHDGVTYGRCVPLSNEYVTLYFGTAQDPPPVRNGDWGPPYEPGLIDPNTTYFWRVVHFDYGTGPVSSPTWSFTTSAEPNPVSLSTWGKIKALYR